MKLRIAFLVLITTLLSACNFTLAEDVTPPPGYIPPTPMPTLSLIPPQTPNVVNGAAIYVEKCAPCHGDTGMGDGPKGIQLGGVTVPAFALPEIARPKSPAQWYTTVTRGSIERFMPPFNSLSDQQRWDVVAYITTLHTTDEQTQKGKDLFEANCADCSTDFFTDAAKTSTLSEVELARIVRLGSNEIKAFGENFSDEEMWDTAAFLRSLSFDISLPATPTAVPATPTLASADASLTPSAEGTPTEGTPQAEVTNEAPVVQEGFGSVSGSIENKTGKDLPKNLIVTLRGYEHDFANPSAGPSEVFSQEGMVASDGTFAFENVELVENRIFIAEVAYDGIALNSEPAIVTTGATTVTVPPLKLYSVTEDTSLLAVDELDIFFDTSQEGVFQIIAVYNFRNTSESIIAVSMGNQQEIPFLKFPEAAQGLGYEAVQDSAPFMGVDQGFAMPPNEIPYGILAFSSKTREKETPISQSLVLPVALVRVFVPDGMEAKGDLLTQDSPQDIQGNQYQTYFASDLKAGDVLDFTVSGSPKTASSATGTTSDKNKTLLIVAGGLGLLLILAGAWMFMRDRNRTEEDDEDMDEEDDEDEFESSEDVMDAIIALDDLYRAKKISEEAYQRRRAELKEILKEMM